MNAPAIPLLELVDASRRYDSADGGPSLEVLRRVSLSIHTGQTVAILGPSGSGKSTLLNVIATLDRPNTGRVLFRGEDVQQRSENELAALRNRSIGLVFQSHHLLPQCTAVENVLIPLLAGANPAEMKEANNRAQQLLERVGLGTRLNHRPAQLSGGERQRIALVRALIRQPVLLLADEPTGSLDRASANAMGNLLRELATEQQMAMVLVTHSVELAARMQRAFELRDGVLVPAGDLT